VTTPTTARLLIVEETCRFERKERKVFFLVAHFLEDRTVQRLGTYIFFKSSIRVTQGTDTRLCPRRGGSNVAGILVGARRLGRRSPTGARERPPTRGRSRGVGPGVLTLAGEGLQHEGGAGPPPPPPPPPPSPGGSSPPPHRRCRPSAVAPRPARLPHRRHHPARASRLRIFGAQFASGHPRPPLTHGCKENRVQARLRRVSRRGHRGVHEHRQCRRSILVQRRLVSGRYRSRCLCAERPRMGGLSPRVLQYAPSHGRVHRRGGGSSSEPPRYPVGHWTRSRPRRTARHVRPRDCALKGAVPGGVEVAVDGRRGGSTGRRACGRPRTRARQALTSSLIH